jgi:hypothetical protein
MTRDTGYYRITNDVVVCYGIAGTLTAQTVRIALEPGLSARPLTDDELNVCEAGEAAIRGKADPGHRPANGCQTETCGAGWCAGSNGAGPEFLRADLRALFLCGSRGKVFSGGSLSPRQRR